MLQNDEADKDDVGKLLNEETGGLRVRKTTSTSSSSEGGWVGQTNLPPYFTHTLTATHPRQM